MWFAVHRVTTLHLLYFSKCRAPIKCRSVTAGTGRQASSFTNWYSRLWQREAPAEPPTQPYSHVCMIGDPVLRSRAHEVLPDQIQTKEIQKVISALKMVMRKYNAVGLSAPQIGVPCRIFVVEVTEKTLETCSPEARNVRDMVLCPSTVVINPSLSILNSHKVTFPEACASITGYSASVARYHELCVEGYTENAEPLTWKVKGWLARIVQHEVDHLDGKLYTDIMDRKTFQFHYWYTVNLLRGNY